MHEDPGVFKKWMPWAIVVTGLMLILLAKYLNDQTGDEVAITHACSMMTFIAGIVCILGGLFTFFVRHDEDVW